MNIHNTNIPDVVVIEPKVFVDKRGYFFETFSEQIFQQKVTDVSFVQDNESMSSCGVLRGLHYQLPPFAQSKLVRVVKGKVLDVAVDIRRGSPTFGKYAAVELSEENKLQLFIPRGFAHGFVVLSETAIFQYKCDNYYAPDYERSIAWDDPQINVDWKIPISEIILSDKDKNNVYLDNCDSLFDYNENYD